MLEQLGTASQLFEACSTSPFGFQHADRVLDGIAPSTALQYLTAICNFLRICQDMRRSIVGLTDGGMADLLLVISLSRSSDSSGISRASSIKALRWLRRSAIVDSLQCVYSTIVDSFLKIKHPKDKREAAPLPLWALIQWERRLLQSSCTDVEVLVLGTFLFMAFSGLGFADLQRFNLRSLVLSSARQELVLALENTNARTPLRLDHKWFSFKGSHSWLWRFLLPDCSDTAVNLFSTRAKKTRTPQSTQHAFPCHNP